MMKDHTKGLSIFVLVNLLVFLLHYYFGNSTSNIVNIPLSYGVNAIAALALCIILYFLNKDSKNQIGFIFLGLSSVKMIAIYFVLVPNDSDGLALKESLTIFIPFLTNLILEQLFMAKILNLREILSPLKKN